MAGQNRRCGNHLAVVVFAFTVYSNPIFGVSTIGGLKFVEEVSAPDPRTVLFRWKQGYPDAVTENNILPPLPRHILGQAYEELLLLGEREPAYALVEQHV
jgi:ABC-type transport system substrate-binding protein